jgi:hypothetical protein
MCCCVLVCVGVCVCGCVCVGLCVGVCVGLCWCECVSLCFNRGIGVSSLLRLDPKMMTLALDMIQTRNVMAIVCLIFWCSMIVFLGVC